MHHFCGGALGGDRPAEVGSRRVLRAQRPFFVVVGRIKYNRIELGVLVLALVAVAAVDGDGASFLMLQIIDFHQNLHRVAAEREGQIPCGDDVVPAAVTNQRPVVDKHIAHGLQRVFDRAAAHRLLQIAGEFVQHSRDRAEFCLVLAL